MANQILKDARLWMGGYNLSGDANRMVIDLSAELQDDSVLEDTARSRMAGLLLTSLQCEGFWRAGSAAPDDVLDGYFALADVPVSACPIAGGGAVGDRAFTFRAVLGEFQRGAAVGELLRYSAGAEGSGGVPLVRGAIVENATRSSSGNASGVQLGALAADQKLYVALHVLSADGSTPSLTVKVQSDDNSGFTSATDRLTFSAKSAIGYDWGSVDGAVADDWWRINCTISGSGPSFRVVAVAGIR